MGSWICTFRNFQELTSENPLTLWIRHEREREREREMAAGEGDTETGDRQGGVYYTAIHLAEHRAQNNLININNTVYMEIGLYIMYYSII